MNSFPSKKEGATLSATRRREAATAFIASADWKILSVRAGKKDESTDDAAPVISVWYAKGLHKNLIRDVLELLGEQTTVTNPVIDGVVLPGDWHHRFAEYRRDSGAGERGDSTHTVYRTMGGGAEGFYHITENGCTTTTSAYYKWDQPEVEAAPAQEQGFSKQIAGVNQDQLTKLFSYVISITEQHTFHDTSVKVAEDEFKTVYREAWTGLRGTKTNPTDDEGTPVAVPAPGSQADGTVVQVNWNHDDRFCTWAVQVSTAVAKTGVIAAEGCALTQFQHEDSLTTAAEADKLGHAPAAVGGLTKRHSSRLREDGLYDNSVDSGQELPVAEAEKTSAVDLFSEEEAHTDQHQTADPPEASVSEGVLTQVSVSKTPGKLRNIRVSVRREKNVKEAQVSKAASIFETSVSTQEKSASEAAPDPVAGGGVTQQVSTAKTPGDRRDVAVATVTELHVEDAAVSEDLDLFRRVLTSADRNSPGAAPSASSGSGVGIQVSADLTPGGRRNIRTQRVEERYVENASLSRGATIFETESSVTHQHSTSSAPAAFAGEGVLINAQESKTPHGRKNIAISIRNEIPVHDATLGKSGDIFQVSTEADDVNVPDPGELAAVNPAVNELSTRSRAKTPGGMRRVSERRVVFNPVSDASVQQTGSLRENAVSVSHVNQPEVPAITTGFVSPGAPIVSLQKRKTPAGAYDYTVGTDTPGPFRHYTINSLIPGTGLYQYIVTFMNASNTDLAGILALYPGYYVTPGYGWNKYALMEGTIKFTPWLGFGSNAYDFLDEEGLTESVVSVEKDGDVVYKKVVTYTYDLKRDEGVSSGLGVYDGALQGSDFKHLGHDWYFYKKVTDITITHEALSGDLEQTVIHPVAEA